MRIPWNLCPTGRLRLGIAALVAAAASFVAATGALGFLMPPAQEGDVGHFRVDVSTAGETFVTWSRYSDDPSRSGLRAARSLPDGGWAWADAADRPGDPAAAIPEPAASSATSTDRLGNSIAVWELNGAMKASVRSAGAAYGPPTIIGTNGGAGPPEIGVGLGASGHAVALWTVETTSGGNPHIASRALMAADRAPDGTWSAPYELAPADGPRSTLTCAGCPEQDRRPAVAVDAVGNAVAAWVSSPPLPAASVILWAERPAGGGWSPPSVLAAPGGTSIQLDVDPSGSALASWIEGGWLHAARKPLSGPFGTAEHLGRVTDLGTGMTRLVPAVSLDTGGRALAIWVSENRRVLASTLAPGRLWSEPVDLAQLTKPEPPSPPRPRVVETPVATPPLLEGVGLSRTTLRRPVPTVLRFRLGSAGEVKVIVQRRGRGKALRGLRVAAGAGEHRIRLFASRPLPPGRYTVRVRVTAEGQTPMTASKRLLVRPS